MVNDVKLVTKRHGSVVIKLKKYIRKYLLQINDGHPGQTVWKKIDAHS